MIPVFLGACLAPVRGGLIFPCWNEVWHVCLICSYVRSVFCYCFSSSGPWRLQGFALLLVLCLLWTNWTWTMCVSHLIFSKDYYTSYGRSLDFTSYSHEQLWWLSWPVDFWMFMLTSLGLLESLTIIIDWEIKHVKNIRLSSLVREILEKMQWVK